MRYFITTSIKASFLGVCLAGGVSLNALANTGSAITGDSAGGNPDSSTFTGDIFVSPSSAGAVDSSNNAGTVQGARRPRPKNWTCNLPFKNQESSLRFKTLATMLSTNLAGSDFLRVLLAPPPEEKVRSSLNAPPVDIPGGPLFDCVGRLNSQPPSENEKDGESEEDKSEDDKTSDTASPIPTLRCPSPSLSGYLSRPVPYEVEVPFWDDKKKTIVFKKQEKSEIDALTKKALGIENSLLALLRLKKESLKPGQEFCGVYKKFANQDNALEETPPEIIQSYLVQDLVTTLFGLIWNETLLGDSQGETLVDANQFSAALKTYNELIKSLTPEQLERWSLPREDWKSPANTKPIPQDPLTSEKIAEGQRVAQDVTATLKMMRSACNCGWTDLWVDEPIPQSETIGSNIPSPNP